MELIPIIIAWSLVTAFIFTTVITCLSLLGWVIFKYPAQQKALFGAIIVELVVGFAGYAVGMLPLDPKSLNRASDEPASHAAVVDVGPAQAPAAPVNTSIEFVTTGDQKIPSGGGEKVFVIQCPKGFRPIGIDPTTSFPARIKVARRQAESWTVAVLNLHGDQRPIGTVSIGLVCRN